MKYIIIIEFDAKSGAAKRLSDAIDAAIVEATQAGGIESLGSQELRGKEAFRFIERLTETPKAS